MVTPDSYSGIRWARNGDTNIAYRVLGEGPMDLVFVTGIASHVEVMTEEPGLRRWFDRLATMGRVVLVDRRGSGLSDPLMGALTLDDEVDDVVAVLDATGSERAVLMAYAMGGPLAIAFACRQPERTLALVLYATMVRSLRADYPWADSIEVRPNGVTAQPFACSGCWSSTRQGAPLRPLVPARLSQTIPTHREDPPMRKFLRASSAKGRWLLAGAALTALLIPTFAIAAGENSPLKQGARNPSNNKSQELTRETEIIANTATYGTRQSNKSNNGGGAIYGCRSKPGGTAANNEPCIRSNNLADGLSFEFESNGILGGTIVTKPGDGSKPFVTNATGVATGLNADRVDSKSATDITNDAVGAVRSATPFAAVNSDGGLQAGRGVIATKRTGAGTYEVVFEADISGCAFQATESQFENAGSVGFSIGADKKTVTVRTRSGGGADGTDATAITDRPFHVVGTCL